MGIVFLHCAARTQGLFFRDEGSLAEKIIIWPFINGRFGLDLFFFISGFLLFISFGKSYHEKRSAPSLTGFYKRRFLRIAPAYYANVIIVLFLSIMVYSRAYGGFRWDGRDLLAHLFFVQNLSSDYSQSINPVLWTLAIEVQFYILLPFIASWFYGKRWLVAAPLLMLVSGGYKYWMIGMYKQYSDGVMNPALPPFNQLIWRLDQFVVGILFASLWLYLESNQEGAMAAGFKRFANMFVAGGLVIIVALFLYRSFHGLVYMDTEFIASPVLSAGFGMCVIGTLYAGIIKNVIANPIVEFVGIISYSVYLWHFPVRICFEVFSPALKEPGLAVFAERVLLIVPLSIALDLVSYLVFERPFLKKGAAA